MLLILHLRSRTTQGFRPQGRGDTVPEVLECACRSLPPGGLQYMILTAITLGALKASLVTRLARAGPKKP